MQGKTGAVSLFALFLTGFDDKAVVDTIISKARNCVGIDPLTTNQNGNCGGTSNCGHSQNPSEALIHRKQLRTGEDGFPDRHDLLSRSKGGALVGNG